MINSTLSTQVPRTFKINLFNYIFITWTSSIHLRMEVKLLVESAVPPLHALLVAIFGKFSFLKF